MSTRTLVALVIAGMVAVAACTSGSGATTSPTTAASASPTASEEPPASASEEPSSSAATGDVTVKTAESSLGTILVDSAGRTLYMFKPDSAGTPTCYDQCAQSWPALTVTGDPVAGPGVTASLTTVARTDGSMQVKVGTWPLYYFANDKAPGDVNGQDISDVWYVVGPDGKPIEG
jgi:predicted lipoprotein with Yx(FWY)xxD motif